MMPLAGQKMKVSKRIIGFSCFRCLVFLLHIVFWCLLTTTSYGDESDVQCLISLKNQLLDPSYNLRRWDFSDRTEGFMCKFNGINCWEDDQRVRDILLSHMNLRGQFPMALKNCTRLKVLDLSKNNLYGPIPSNIDEIIPLVTTLDLSYNNFSGGIPSKLGRLTDLNTLYLQFNYFTGKIPKQLGRLARLNSFSVAANSLSGKIPCFGDNGGKKFNESSFAYNNGLSGKPSNSCKVSTKFFLCVAFSGGLIFGTTVVAVAWFYKVSKIKASEGKLSAMEKDIEGNNWEDSVLSNTILKMRLEDLKKITNNFSDANIIGLDRSGVIYKATLSDGSLVTVKRLQNAQKHRAEFISEISTLGRVKHCNLVPFLGFCIAKKERFLVYRHKLRRTLYQQLHQVDATGISMEWPLRLKIACGVARGLAWLHHNSKPCIIHCNISSRCILLGENDEPKISDFGFAKLLNRFDTHLSTFTEGDFDNLGYVAPEYTRSCWPVERVTFTASGFCCLS